MTSSKRIGLAASLVLGMLSVAAVAAPANAAWWGNGQWHPDNRWDDNNPGAAIRRHAQRRQSEIADR